MQHLLLFDIDGTLLFTHGVGRASVAAAMQTVCGRPLSTDAVSFSGKTDPQIFREVCAANGMSAEDTEALLPDLLRAYANEMEARMPSGRITVLPGVRPLLDALSRTDDVALGLVTGNLEPMAYLKLKYAALDGYFPFGAFGSDSAHRPDLPGIALERARSSTGFPLQGHHVTIIGDTEHDIACGRGIGARALAVCTGNYKAHDLVHHQPWALFEDLSDTHAVVSTLLQR